MTKDIAFINGSIDNKSLIFFVNGKKVIENNPDTECTLLTYLRNKLHLCGTKLGCGEGGCGACTVMLSKIDRRTNEIKHFSANACLTPVCSVHGMAVTTVEGIGNTRTRLHPVQERIAKAHGSQCGFCTPGIVMSMYSLLRCQPLPSMKDIEIAFQGNLCRCTGYRPIIEAYKTFTDKYACAMGENCCKVNGNMSNNFKEIDYKLFEKSEFKPYDPSQEPIFPPELKVSDILDRELLIFKGERVTWYRPTKLEEILHLKAKYPNAKIVVGNTEVGVEVKFKHFLYPVIIQPSQIKEMNSIVITNAGIKVGASVTLTDIENVFNMQINERPEHETRLFQCVVDMLHYFAGHQIRNVASIGGNLMTGSPISDMNPILMASEVELEVASLKEGFRKIRMNEEFFTGYRKNIVRPEEILVSIFFPITNINQHFVAYKQAKRREDDITIVNCAFNIFFKPETNIIEKIIMAFGGISPITVLARKTASAIEGKIFNKNLVETVANLLCEEFPLDPSAPGGMVSYRRTLIISLFFKAYLTVSRKLSGTNNEQEFFEKEEKSGADTFFTKEPKSTQLFEKPSDSQSIIDPVGRPFTHVSALKQATGEAIYCDDIPRMDNELYLALVLSTKAHAKIISIDPKEALNMKGVHAFFSAKDLDDHQNLVGPVFHDEEVFARTTVYSLGQTIGAIVADDQSLAQRAARMVKVQYEELSPIIVTIEDAIDHKSYFPGYPKTIVKGDVESEFKKADHVIEGSCRMGGQEHFYLETHASLAIPRDSDELELFCSSQHPSEVQKLVSHVLSVPSCKIVTRVKRLGGGFGGKESRGILVSLPCALAAYKLRRPVRCMLDRDEDMLITGTRHPFYFKYKVACTKEGKITACEIECYNNAGYSMDLSFSVLERAMFHFENSYLIPNARVIGYVCKTNLPSNTAFRGFGGPQGMFAGEHIIRDVARITGRSYVDVAWLNLYKEGDLTHYNQKLENCNIRRCWEECLKQSNFYDQRKAIEEFNKQNRWKKRGLSIVTTKFGIAFTALHLNQAGALIHVYQDGSVLISHGGTEMGQGLHTKIIQIAAKVLEIPVELIHVSESSTDKVPNTSATAASVGSDINGMAVLNACQEINKRLQPVKQKLPHENWKKWVSYAYLNRISLSATGFYKIPDIGYSFETNSGNPFSYFTYGVGCSSVEIDCLTGDHQVLRTDIVMDVGSSLNPAIDIGQIEGAFMQGYGLFTLEEMIYSPTGIVISRGPGMYKIPGFADIPAEFNVSLLTGSKNPRAVFSSKAIGEPPLFLASSVFFAIKEAISAARKSENKTDHFNLISPATSARIRMACEDSFTQKISEPKQGTFKPWNVMP